MNEIVDDVVVSRINNTGIELSQIMVEYDIKKCKEEINRTIEKEEQLKNKIDSSVLAETEFLNICEGGKWLMYKNETFDSIMSSPLKKILSMKAIDALSKLYQPIKITKKAFSGHPLSFDSVIRMAKKENRTLTLYDKKVSATIVFSEFDRFFNTDMCFVGLSSDNLEEGYAFAGDDTTGKYNKIKKLDEKQTYETLLPQKKAFVKEELPHLADLSEDDFPYVLTGLTLKYVKGLCDKGGVKYKNAKICNGDWGTYTKILDETPT